ncbi:MAG: hypothetical protein LC808_28565 [Actinobacteria bacterium]|nr:hypothetical protein [Actinomycetota bacterium]
MTALQAAALSTREWYPATAEDAHAAPADVSHLQVTGRSEWGTAPPWLRDAEERMRHLEKLGDDWDSYGSARVDPRLRKAVARFLSAPLWASTPRPWIVPTSQGGLAVEWRGRRATLALEFDPRGSVEVYFGDEDSGTEWEGDLDEEPDELEAWVWRVTYG